jgi:uncharacterized protein with HEPN domain
LDLRTAKRLHDALTAATRIRRNIDGRTFEDYVVDDYLRSAVERQFEVLSEALNAAESQQPDLRERFPEIPVIVGMRNRIAHSYDRLSLRTIWDAAVVSVPPLLPRLEAELGEVDLPDDFYQE